MPKGQKNRVRQKVTKCHRLLQGTGVLSKGGVSGCNKARACIPSLDDCRSDFGELQLEWRARFSLQKKKPSWSQWMCLPADEEKPFCA